MRILYLLSAILTCMAPVRAMEPDSLRTEPAPLAQSPGAARPAEVADSVPPVAAAPASAVERAATSSAPRAEDRIELDTTQITGNRELPRVLYVVPWKQSDLGDSAGRPTNSLLDEVLSPVDRDVFRRQSRYYEALQPDAKGAGSEAEK